LLVTDSPCKVLYYIPLSEQTKMDFDVPFPLKLVDKQSIPVGDIPRLASLLALISNQYYDAVGRVTGRASSQ